MCGSRTPFDDFIRAVVSFQKRLVETGFTQQNEEQYFQFLAKFEIALPVANDR